ncbi:MAG TPA: hypothetical protein VFV07_02315 [Rhizomicrobium sp.]|nr:hypothetical protein [Rhizomicrobium sp.]
MGFLLFLLELTVVLVVPMAALFYGYRALRWGFDHYPWPTRLVAVLLFGLLITAWLTFGRVAPGCYAFHASTIVIPIGDCRH